MKKAYAVKEIFHSIQGEGFHYGRPAVFVRFSGCNLWSGREKDRAKAVCQFCDTEFVGGAKMTAAEIVEEVCRHPTRFVILTGGEPALQIDNELVRLLQRRNCYVAVETNGTQPLPSALDWVCVSPKAGSKIIIREADEIKLVYPQPGMMPHIALLHVHAKHKWISPMDGPMLEENTREAVKFVRNAWPWRLTMQAHKIWGIA